ncbi:MAG TPA: hypothetical protein DCR93_10815 [Cytophagales bacterium]|nr:hypothetical protein [Cytophagales bacterium]
MKDPIAIIGLSFTLPGIPDWESLVAKLRNAEPQIGDLPASRKEDIFAVTGPFPVKEAGFLERVDAFDRRYFGLNEPEALRLSPEQRMMMMQALEAFYDAGYAEADLKGTQTGVYYTSELSQYQQLYGPYLGGNVDALPGMEGTRLANFLDLRGPVLSINTTCSSALAALHEACNHLHLQECDLALVGGAKMIVQDKGVEDRSTVMAKSGACRPFDDAADGTLSGEGSVCLVLKRWSEAQRDGDRVYAVIEGSAVNHGGARLSSLTAPSAEAQAEVITKAWKRARVSAQELGFLEAHGTGTILGDPIEFEGLRSAFTALGADPGTVGFSSFKGQVGHLDTLSGLAGMVRLIAAMQVGIKPGQAGFRTLNKFFKQQGSPVQVQESTTDWASQEGRRVGAVSSYGLTGTNVHVVLSQQEEEPPQAEGPYFVQWGGKTTEELHHTRGHLMQGLTQSPGINLQAWAQKVTRLYQEHPYRASASFHTYEEALEVLGAPAQPPVKTFPKLFVLNLDLLPFSQVEGERILNQNALIQKAWDELVGVPYTELATQARLRQVFVQATLVRYVLSMAGKAATLISRKDESSVQDLVSGKVTAHELIANPAALKEAQAEFNTEAFLAHLQKVISGGQPVALMGFCAQPNLILDRLPDDTPWISGAFSSADAAKLYSLPHAAGKSWIKLKATAALTPQLRLPAFRKERVWPKVPESVAAQAATEVSEAPSSPEATAVDVRAVLGELWVTYLELDALPTDEDDFFELGGDSITGLDILSELESATGVAMDYQEIFDYPSFQALTMLIEQRLQAETPVGTEEKPSEKSLATLDSTGREVAYQALVQDLTHSKEAHPRTAGKILLTGGTGFLGAFLVHALLETTEASLVCLVRGEDDAAATRRFWDTYLGYFPDASEQTRVTIIAAELTQPDLGISSNAALSGVEEVYHCAATVSHFGKLEDSHQINVLGTKHLADWAVAHGVKVFHHCSTMAVGGLWVPGESSVAFYETDLNLGQEYHTHIYGSTKRQAEEYLRALAGTMRVHVYRLGNIGGATGSGLFQTNIEKHNIYLLLKAFATVGEVSPALAPMRLELSPVDRLVQAMLTLGNASQSALQTFHLFDHQPYTLAEIVSAFCHNGIDIPEVEDEVFFQHLEVISQDPVRGRDLVSLGIARYANAQMQEQEQTDITPRLEATHTLLAAQNQPWEYDRQAYLNTVIRYCIQKQFITAPQEQTVS